MAIQRDREIGETPEIPVYRIDGFVDAYTEDGDGQLVVSKLVELGFSSPDFAFRAIAPDSIEEIIHMGTDRKDDLLDISLVFPGIGVISRGELNQLLRNMNDCREGEKEAAFVVYDLSQLDDNPKYKEGGEVGTPEWIFKNPDNKREAVKAIVVAEDFGITN